MEAQTPATHHRTSVLWAVLACLFGLLMSPAGFATPGEYCSDWEREDKAAAEAIKAEMKAKARGMGVPERLMHLYDELPDCKMCLEDMPAVPSITVHYVPNSDPKKTAALRNVKAISAVWSADLEFEARYGMREGYVQAFYIYLARGHCICCTAENEEEYEDWQPHLEDPSTSPHYIEELDLDSGLSEVVDDPDELGEDPADLTELSADEKYPDMIEPPPLILPPPVRPVTSLCTQCQPQVDAHNEHTAKINARQHAIAELKQSRGVTSKAISYRLRAIHAHRRKAHTGDWEEVADAMEVHLWDLEATYDRETRAIKAAEREVADLLEELLGLKQAVWDCEETCRLEDSQAEPTTAPDPVPEGEEAALPPYVRIATQSCAACEDPVEFRNNLARQMNAVVGEMLGSGDSAKLRARWNALRDELELANTALRECLPQCDQPLEESVPKSSSQGLSEAVPGDSSPPDSPGVAKPLSTEEQYERWRRDFDRCEPCNKYWHSYREMADRALAKYAELRAVRKQKRKVLHDLRWYQERADVLEAALKLDLSDRRRAQVHRELRRAWRLANELEQEYRGLYRLESRLRDEAVALETKALRIRVEWRHCVATKCKLSVSLPMERMHVLMGNIYDGTNPLADQTMLMFVTTTCDPCREDARYLNDWLLEQYQSWMIDYMILHGSNFTAFKRFNNSQGSQWEDFLAQYTLLKSELESCEKQCQLPDATPDPYQSPAIGSNTCTGDLLDDLFQEAGDGEVAPSCQSWLSSGEYSDDCSSGGCDQAADSGTTGSDCDSAGADALPNCSGSGYTGEYTGDCSSSGSCDQSPDLEFDAGPCDGTWSGAPPPSCQGSAVMDWYTSDCSSGGCDQLTSPQPTANPCESECTADESGWQVPLGCSGVARIIQAPAQTDDPYLSSTGSLKPGVPDTWGLQAIQAFGGERLASTDEPVVVAVIDSGVDGEHPELEGSLWRNAAEVPGNGIDDDGNGFVDDVHGWNFLNGSADTRDTNGHGTIVAGIIAASADNGIGIAGVNPAARIMPLKVTNYLGVGNSIDIAAAVVYAVNNGASVVNISLGGPVFSPAEKIALDYASRKGVLVVVASGNTATDTAGFWPAGIPAVFTVAAVDVQRKRAPYSNWGSAVDIAAPGSDILSLRARYTDPAFFVDPGYEREGYIVGEDRLLYVASGTSFSAPFVSGVASLRLQADPGLDSEQLAQILQQSADDIESPGHDALTGYGLLNATAALQNSPDFYISARITGITVKRDGDTPQLQVLGSADAERYAGATVSMGEGRTPSSWQAVATLKRPVTEGVLAEVPASAFAGAAQWTLRLETTHKDGRTREHQFPLKLR